MREMTQEEIASDLFDECARRGEALTAAKERIAELEAALTKARAALANVSQMLGKMSHEARQQAYEATKVEDPPIK